MPAEPQHPTQSVAPGAEPQQPGPRPDARLVDPEEAITAEFLPTANPETTDTTGPATRSGTDHG